MVPAQLSFQGNERQYLNVLYIKPKKKKKKHAYVLREQVHSF